MAWSMDIINSRASLQELCKAVRKQSRLYQESVRSLAELDDTTGVDLCAGQSAVRDRSMVSIKAEKMERARTYRRIMQVLCCFTLLPRSTNCSKRSHQSKLWHCHVHRWLIEARESLRLACAHANGSMYAVFREDSARGVQLVLETPTSSAMP